MIEQSISTAMEDLSRSFGGNTNTYTLKTFVDDERTTLPRIVQVVDGFCGESEEETIENGQILILHEVQQEQFVVMNSSNGVEFCIPRTCPIKVELVPLDRLNDEYITVEELFMAQPVFFRVLDDISSYGLEAGSVMKICQRQTGVYYLECQVVGDEEVIKLPLTQRGRFQPLHDDREYFLEEVLAQYPPPSQIGVRFLNTVDRLLSETFRDSQEDTALLPCGVGLRLEREFQDDTVIATAVGEGEGEGEGEGGDVMLFPKTLDLSIVPAVDCSENNEVGKLSTTCQLSTTTSFCLKRVRRLSATRAHSIICPVRRFSLECLTPPPLNKPCKPRISPKLQEPYSYPFISIKASTEGRPREPARDMTDLPKQRVNQETETDADLEGINGNECVEEEIGPSAQWPSLPKRHQTSHTERNGNNSVEKEYSLSQGASNQRSLPLEVQPIDRRNLSDNERTIASAKRSSLKPLLPRKQNEKRGQASKVIISKNQGSNTEEQILCDVKSSIRLMEEDESHEKRTLMTLGSNQLSTVVKPIPKPRNAKKCASNTLLSIGVSNPCSTADSLMTDNAKSNTKSSSDHMADRQVLEPVNSRHTIDRRFRSEDRQKQLGTQALDTSYININSQQKVLDVIKERVLYGVSDGTLLPNVTRQRTRHHWHTETVTLGSLAYDQLRETNQGQAGLDRVLNDLPPYINVNPLLLDSRMSLPVASGAQACDGTRSTARYINESVFHFTSSQWHHSFSDDVKAVPTHLDRQGEPVSGGIPQQTPYYVNHAPFPPSHGNTGTVSANAPIDDEIVKTVASTSQLISAPYVNSNPMPLSSECSESSTGTMEKSSKPANSEFQTDGREETRGMATLLVHPESSSEGDKNLNTFIANECRNGSEVRCSNMTTTVTYSVDRVLDGAQGISRSQGRNGYENDRLWVDSRDGKEPRSQLKITDQEYCSMEEGFRDDDDHIGELRERSDTYSYPYVHFYPPRRRNEQNSSESLPTKNIERNSARNDVWEDHMKRGPRLTGSSYKDGCIEQRTPKLPEKPLFLQQRQDTCSITQIDTASHAPPLPPKRGMSSNLTTPAPGSEEDGEGAYLIVDLANNPFLEEHPYQEVDDPEVQERDNSALPQERNETCSLSQGRPVSCEPPLPPKKLASPQHNEGPSSTPNMERCPPAGAYEGSYSMIPPLEKSRQKKGSDAQSTDELENSGDKELYDQDYEEYDPGETIARTMQIKGPLQQLKEAFQVSSSKGKAKKQKEKKDKSKHAGVKVIKDRKSHCPIQTQIEHVPRSSTYHRSDHQREFEDFDTLKLFMDMQNQISLQRKLFEAEMSRQKADFAAEMSRHEALTAKTELEGDLIKSDRVRDYNDCQISDGTTTKDPQAESESLRERVGATKPRNVRCENVHVVGHTYLNESRLNVSGEDRDKATTANATSLTPKTTEGSKSSSESHENDSGEVRACAKSKKPVPIPRRRK